MTQSNFTMPPRFKAELRASLLSHAAALPAVTVTPKPRRAGRRVGPALVVGVAALASVLAIAGGGGGGLVPRRTSAVQVLNASAMALDRSGRSLSLSGGQYFYARTMTWFRYAWAGTRQFIVSGVNEEWVASNGSGRLRFRVRTVVGRPANGFGAAARSSDASIRASGLLFPLSSSANSRHTGLSYAQLRALPADPQRLSGRINRLVARQLRDYHGVRGLALRQLRSVLRFAALRGVAESPTPPQVRAAVYRALALTPGLRLLGRRSDAAGRTGMAVAARVGALRFVLIIDPSTGQLLQSSRLLLQRSAQMPGWPPGLINRDTFLASGTVNSTHAWVP